MRQQFTMLIPTDSPARTGPRTCATLTAGDGRTSSDPSNASSPNTASTPTPGKEKPRDHVR